MKEILQNPTGLAVEAASKAADYMWGRAKESGEMMAENFVDQLDTYVDNKMT
jgi:hypothetical protein